MPDYREGRPVSGKKGYDFWGEAGKWWEGLRGGMEDWWAQSPAWQKLLIPGFGPSLAAYQQFAPYFGQGGTPTEEVEEAEGKYPIYPEAYGATPEEWPIEPMSEYQREQLRLREKELEWQMSQAQASGDMTAYQRAQLELQQLQLELQREQWQAGLMASPRDWIQRWYAQQGPTGRGENMRQFDPIPKMRGAFEARQAYGGQTAEETAQQAFESINAWRRMREDRMGRDFTPTEERALVKEWYLEQLPHKRDKEGRGPKAPPAPEWLPAFAPGQVAGEELKRGIPTQTPSGQQWAATPWSQRQGLAGYMDWAGGRGFRDMLDQMAMMQPRTPQAARGWRTPKQR